MLLYPGTCLLFVRRRNTCSFPFWIAPPPKGYDIILLISIKIPTTNTKGLPGYCRLYHMIDAGRTVLPGLDVYWWGVFCFLTFCWRTGMRDDAWFIGGDNDDGDIRIGATFFSPPFNVVRGCPESFPIFAMRAASCCCSSFLSSSSSLAYRTFCAFCRHSYWRHLLLLTPFQRREGAPGILPHFCYARSELLLKPLARLFSCHRRLWLTFCAFRRHRLCRGSLC
jgi:hypothetical protein